MHTVYLLHMVLSSWYTHAQLLLSCRVASLRRPPSHLGLVIGEGEVRDTHDVLQLAKLINWCIGMGMRRITVCDMNGELAATPRSVHNALRSLNVALLPLEAKLADLSSPDSPLAITIHGEGDVFVLRLITLQTGHGEGDAFVLRLVTLQTGRDDIVCAARRLCAKVANGELPPNAIDEAVVEQQLLVNSGFPDPELVLQFCPRLLLGGLLPWHCSVTQYSHLDVYAMLRNGSYIKRYVNLKESSNDMDVEQWPVDVEKVRLRHV
eukprot:CAMPEP_0182834448 /NCGR_PEP_ID=MMETSP0006_2-20121128/20924_1 /TAXON_ID=97485 /ORGANISM="Prymnesium parvum, Strain Texoma1" /LENGTH=264 /DNA_ID=CAMNT_0024962703 /DNA_START=1 /DNA_END=797 /DNA_ORIENTATION=-